MESKRAFVDGVIIVVGKRGRDIPTIARDFTFMGGSLGEIRALKIINAIGYALKGEDPPIYSLNDSEGTEIQKGIDALRGHGGIFRLNSLASGKISQIAVIGPEDATQILLDKGSQR